MTYDRRSFSRLTGYAGLVGCLLVGTSTLVHAQNYPPYYSQAERVHIAATYARQQSIASGTAVVPVDARARWTSPDGSMTRYRTSTINVPKSTLRIGALSALGRGVMHPGLHIAIVAAGFIYSQSDGITKLEPSSSELHYDSNQINLDSWHASNTGYGYSINGQNYNLPILNDNSHLHSYCERSDFYCYITDVSAGSNNRTLVRFEVRRTSNNSSVSGHSHIYNNVVSSNYIDGYIPGENQVPITEDDYLLIDPHIPPSLYDELWNGAPIPEWQDAITVLASPASDVSADGALAPEVASAMGRWGQNMDAQYNGNPAPNPDHPTTGNTAQDQVAEEFLDGNIPSFPDIDVQWQTEVLDLPSFSSGIGGGSCPGPASIPLPGGTGSVDISYQPACDLATMVRPALIGISGLIACMIVLRARGGS